MKGLRIVVACSENWGIGFQGKIPWKAPSDLKFLKTLTSSATNGKTNAVIMGRVTYESVGKPLPNRQNYVISHSKQKMPGVIVCDSLEKAIINAREDSSIEKIFILGGAEIYKETLKYRELIDRLYVTRIHVNVECDRFFEWDTSDYGLAESRDVVEERLTFEEYYPRNHQEQQYLDLIKRIIETGDPRDDRTRVGTIATFGERMVFDISERIPLLTTKRTAWKTMLRELLWFIAGDTDAKKLQAQGVRIWDGNSSREFLDSRGLTHLEEGDLGKVYGFNWRHFGAKYVDCHTDYSGQGVDQLANLIEMIKNDPTSRRMLFTGWDPASLKDAALPPCHLLAQFFVRQGEYLDCQMYQRSCDMGLGVPFNIASYSFLTYMIAHVTGLRPGKFIHVLGDTHVYQNHIEALKEQLAREPYVFPRLEIVRRVDSLFDFKESDFVVHDYIYHPPIKMEMAV